MLEFQKISKSFSGVEVLHQISFNLDNGKIIALVGENGAGKSTLMKILCGILTDYSGQIFLKGEAVSFHGPKEAEEHGIAMIHQELNLIPDLTIGENIFLGKEPTSGFGRIDFKKLYEDTEKILQEFDFPYQSKMKIRNLTVGWQQMVEIAKALQVNAELLVMDEPTSALSEHEIEILFNKIKFLRSRGKTIIFISHRLKEVFDIADEILVLRDGNFVGKFDKKKVSREKLISLMIGYEIPEPPTQKHVAQKHENILILDDIFISLKSGMKLSNLKFSLKPGDILGVAGLLGAGRTELLKFLYGELKGKYSGNLMLKNNQWHPKNPGESLRQKIVYLSENRKIDGIFPHHHLRFNSSISYLPELSIAGIIQQQQEIQIVETKFKELNVRRRSLRQNITTLSGGNQQKVLLSRILLLNPDLLLLDEPTRGIDVGAKEEIYQLIFQLSRNGAVIIFTSSEIPELMRVCQQILVLAQGRQTALFMSDKTNPQEILKFAFKQD